MSLQSTVVVDERGIDVGHFSTKYTLGRKPGLGSTISAALFPSLPTTATATVAANSSHLDGTIVTVNDSKYFVGKDAMFAVSGNETREVLADYCKTEKYKALTRGALHYIMEDAGAKSTMIIRNLVVGLPFTTFDSHKEYLKKELQGEHVLAGEIPGYSRTVLCENVHVLAQPQGAVTNYGVSNRIDLADKNVLVVDPGGGTVDWHLVGGRRSNWKRSGAQSKSMLACAYAIADSIDKEWHNNIGSIDRIDRALSLGLPTFTISGDEYKVADYAPLIEIVLEDAMGSMLATVHNFSDIDMFLFTGGGAKLFMEFFKRKFPKLAKLAVVDSDSVFSNVKGFHMYGEFLASRKTA